MRGPVCAIVPAAGSGLRLGLKTKKPFVLLDKKPLVWYVLNALEHADAVDGIVIAAERACITKIERLVRRFGLRKVRAVVAGGATRSASVYNALKAVDPSVEIVLVQDAARPFLTAAFIDESVAAARRYGGCVVAVPESDTVKMVDGKLFARKTLARSALVRAQTPQAFRREILLGAYKMLIARRGLSGVTDDASILEAAGRRVKVVMGSYGNIKITTVEDLRYAEWLLGGAKNKNVGAHPRACF